MGFLQLQTISKVNHIENTQILMFDFHLWIFHDIKETEDFRKFYVFLTFRVDHFLPLKNNELYHPGWRRFLFWLKGETSYIVHGK